MTDDDRTDRRRRVVMSDDDRALIGGRARSASGEIDNADTLDDDAPDPSDLTPVGTFADRYNDPDIRRLAIDLDRRQAHRTMQTLAGKPLGDADRERIEDDIDRLHKKTSELQRRNALYDKQIGEHHEADKHQFRRIDEKLGEIEKRDEKREKQDGKIRTAIIGGAISLVITAGTAVGALLKSARGEGDEDATIRALVDKSRELDAELTEIRTLLWRRFVPFPPAGPASGVTP